jgi:ribosomal protein S1
MLETANKSEEWAKLKTELHVGQVIEGKVLAHWPFGIFVDLNKPFVGLVEIVNFRERGERMTPNEYPELGAPIKAVILQFSDSNFQVKLSVRPGDLPASK